MFFFRILVGILCILVDFSSTLFHILFFVLKSDIFWGKVLFRALTKELPDWASIKFYVAIGL